MIVQNTVKIAAYEHIQQDSTRYFYVVVICSLFDFYVLNSCFIFWDEFRQYRTKTALYMHIGIRSWAYFHQCFLIIVCFHTQKMLHKGNYKCKFPLCSNDLYIKFRQHADMTWPHQSMQNLFCINWITDPSDLARTMYTMNVLCKLIAWRSCVP